MGAPYVSKRRLIANSESAMLSAIEIYNKPRLMYRDEITVILIVNAYELLLKALLRDAGKNIHYRKRRGEPYLTISLDDSIRRAHSAKLWHGLDGKAIEANITSLAEYRNRAIHFYNSQDLATLVYYLLQQAVINYKDLLYASFKREISNEMTWQLLPLGASPPPEDISFLDPSPKRNAVKEAQDFIDHLRQRLETVEQAEGDVGRVVTVYDVHMQSVKRYGSRDLLVGVDQESDGRIVFKDRDARDTHPYTMTQMLVLANDRGEPDSVRLTSYTFQALVWKYKLRDDEKFFWKHPEQATSLWSEQAVNWFAKVTDRQIEEARSEYTNRAKAKS